jgi:hypothetical protein
MWFGRIRNSSLKNDSAINFVTLDATFFLLPERIILGAFLALAA